MIELLTTKQFIPRPRKILVSRPRLVERLNAGLDKKFTLIAAPAGFGKTTLLSEWILQSPCCVTWLSLDEGDNDPTKFWAYFISSLERLRPDLGVSALVLLQSPQSPPITSILTALINDITAFSDAFAMVLDDYHVIESQPIHEALTFLIDHLPTNMHLVITSRIDPPLSLARLRARDELIELRAHDLRFGADETAAFLNQVMGLNLSEEEVTMLESRTDGWIAGLQIAALSMQGRDDVQGFIQAFSGSHRHILGYLAEEVLTRQPEKTMRFLLQTSILDRLCGPLCDAVTGDSDAQAILENLEHANLFITPLDDEGKWYRYHHLFAEVLQVRLRQANPANVPKLHSRASAWYARQGLINEAITHVLAVPDFTQAVEFIEPLAQSMWQRGEGTTLQMWLDALPNDLRRVRPRLCLAQFWMALTLGQLETIELRAQEVEVALRAAAGTESASLSTESIAMRAIVASLWQDTPQTIEFAQEALERLPENEQYLRGLVEFSLGNAYLWQGDLVAAYQSLVEAASLCHAVGNVSFAILALDTLAMACVMQGQLRQAAALYRQALQIGKTEGGLLPMAGVAGACVGLGGILHDWYQLEEAAGYLRQGLDMAHQLASTGVLVGGYGSLARLMQTQGDLAGAIDATQQAEMSFRQSQMPKGLEQIQAYRARLYMAQGDIAAATHWSAAWEHGHPLLDQAELETQSLYPFEIERLSLVRILVGQEQTDKALSMLTQLLRLGEVRGHVNLMIETLVLKALVFQSQSVKEPALAELGCALTLAEPDGYIRTFVDEGEPMRLLLLDYQAIIKRNISDGVDSESVRLLAYTDKLLAAFSQPAPVEKSKHETISEALSERELVILRLIAAGNSNLEIAEQLVLAQSTVKWYINSLYSKLGAKSRTHALALARELELI